MGTRLLKEARGLLPIWGATLLLVLGPWIVRLPFVRALGPQLAWILVPLAYCGLVLGGALLAGSVFGREFDHGTFGLLRCQPMSRWRIWWEKTGVLTLALASVWGAWHLSLSPAEDASGSPVATVMLGLVSSAYGGGLLFALLARQTVGGACLSLAASSVVMMAAAIVREATDAPITAEQWLLCHVAWAIVAYALALRLWLRSRDIAGGLPSIGLVGLHLRARGSGPGRVSPWRALLWKELHLQQWAVYLALALPLLMILGRFVLPWIGYDPGHGGRVAYGTVFIFLVWLTPIVPALAGFTAVAEERRLGTLAGQRTMPASHGWQFTLKLGVAWALALFCAPWLPLLGSEASDLPFVGASSIASVAVMTSAIAALAVFGSSLASNLVGALVASVVTGLALVGGLSVAPYLWARLHLHHFSYSWSILLGVIGVPLATLALLASRNARHLATHPRLVLRNAIVLALVCAAVVVFLVGRPALATRAEAATFRAHTAAWRIGCERGEAQGCEALIAGGFYGYLSDRDTLSVADTCRRHVRAIIDDRRLPQERGTALRLAALAHRGYDQACASGLTEACARERDTQLAACDLGAPDCLTLARAYESGGDVMGLSFAASQRVPKDKAMAVQLYSRACQAGEPRGCVRAAELLARGDGVPQDKVRAAELYDKACRGGLASACEGALTQP